MAQFTTFDQVLNRLADPVAKNVQRTFFQKDYTHGLTNKIWFTNWIEPGMPGAGQIPATGTVGAAKCTRLTGGAIPFNNPASGNTLHLLHAGALTGGAGGTHIVFCDRLAHIGVLNTQTDTDFLAPALSAIDRLETGAGGQIVIEVVVPQSGGWNVKNLTYTNELGVAGRVTQNFQAPGNALGTAGPLNSLFLPLQTGDMGVRSIEAVTNVSGAGSAGQITVAIVKPLFILNMTSPNFYVSKDFVLHLPSLPQIKSDTCFCMYMFRANTGSALPCILGELRFVEQN